MKPYSPLKIKILGGTSGMPLHESGLPKDLPQNKNPFILAMGEKNGANAPFSVQSKIIP